MLRLAQAVRRWSGSRTTHRAKRVSPLAGDRPAQLPRARCPATGKLIAVRVAGLLGQRPPTCVLASPRTSGRIAGSQGRIGSGWTARRSPKAVTETGVLPPSRRRDTGGSGPHPKIALRSAGADPKVPLRGVEQLGQLASLISWRPRVRIPSPQLQARRFSHSLATCHTPILKRNARINENGARDDGRTGLQTSHVLGVERVTSSRSIILTLNKRFLIAFGHGRQLAETSNWSSAWCSAMDAITERRRRS